MGFLKTLTLLALTTSTAFAKPYPVHDEELMQTHNATQKRADCAGVSCGWDNWLCCPSGSTCGVDANNQAVCGTASAGSGGGWAYYTTTYVETLGAVTKTSIGSSYTGGQAATTGAASPGCANSAQTCGSVCCESGLYCYDANTSQCKAIAGGSSGGIVPTISASAPVRPTQSSFVIITYTGTPTATGPFQTPVPTGANGSLTEEDANNGLSGGAIAGIVIGVLLGILLLLLLCLFCCARALFDTLLGILGIGGKRKHTHEETTYVEDHHHSGGAAAAGGRWYGAGPSRPNRPMSEKKSGFGGKMGMAAALGGLALALGMKRKHDKEDKSTTISGSSYYYSDYTSSSKFSQSKTPLLFFDRGDEANKR